MTVNITDGLEKELRGRITLTRLAKTGFFRRATPVPEDIRKEVELFRSVLDKALIDFFSPRSDLREDVVDWLNLKNKDFVLVCECAMLQPELVIQGFHAVKRMLRKKNTHPNDR